MNKIKDMVSGGKVASFSHYSDQQLIYKTECGFEFPVPIHDAKGGVFKNEMKAITLMRWIRQHIKLIESYHDEKE